MKRGFDNTELRYSQAIDGVNLSYDEISTVIQSKKYLSEDKYKHTRNYMKTLEFIYEGPPITDIEVIKLYKQLVYKLPNFGTSIWNVPRQHKLLNSIVSAMTKPQLSNFDLVFNSLKIYILFVKAKIFKDLNGRLGRLLIPWMWNYHGLNANEHYLSVYFYTYKEFYEKLFSQYSTIENEALLFFTNLILYEGNKNVRE